MNVIHVEMLQELRDARAADRSEAVLKREAQKAAVQARQRAEDVHAAAALAKAASEARTAGHLDLAGELTRQLLSF
jgi:hypothetical protein